MDNIHDKHFKESLGEKENAIAFLNVTLPANVRSLIDVNALTSVKESFISPDFK